MIMYELVLWILYYYYKSHRCVRMKIDEINNNEESFFRGK